MIIVAITSPKEDPKVPFEEQLLSTGAAIQNFLLALHAQGFGSMWRTGPLSWHPVVSEGLGLESGERIAGFIYVGTELNSARNSALLAIQDFVKKWPL
jgi:nitroreductase